MLMEKVNLIQNVTKREVCKTNPRGCLQCLVNYPNPYLGCLGYADGRVSYFLVLFSCTTTFITNINERSRAHKNFITSYF